MKSTQLVFIIHFFKTYAISEIFFRISYIKGIYYLPVK